MAYLRYYTQATLDNIRNSIGENLDWYYCHSREANGSFFFALPGVRNSRLAAPDLADRLIIDTDRSHITDVDNALVMYETLYELTPHQASDERLWAYLCHCECPRYASVRWFNDRPEKDEDAVRQVQNHFFVNGNRALIRDNAASRLWWLGKIAHDIAPDNPREFLTILLHRQDVRSALIERPSVSMNRDVLRGIYTLMQWHWNNGRQIFERRAFRNWMINLNRRGGVVLLDALPDDILTKVLSEEADRALSQSA